MFLAFRKWEIWYFFLKKVDGKMIFGIFELSVIFQDLRNMAFGAVLKFLKYQNLKFNFEIIEINAGISQMIAISNSKD